MFLRTLKVFLALVILALAVLLVVPLSFGLREPGFAGGTAPRRVKEALAAAKKAVDVTKAKLGKLEFCQYAFTLYQHALSEKRISGNAIVTPGIAVFLLEQRLKQPQAS